MEGRADVLIIGAGAAGLAAARDIAAAGLRVVVVEARERVGGRIFTLREGESETPVELGAEFIHGRPRETLDLVKSAGLTLRPVSGRHWHVRGGELTKSSEFWSRLEEINKRMERATGRDHSFEQFLETEARDEPEEVKQIARLYVEGFHAARAERVGVQGLNRTNRAEEEIDGDEQSRINEGYDRVARWLRESAQASGAEFLLNAVVEDVRWSRGRVELRGTTRQGMPDGGRSFKCEASRLVVTLPLGVLQAREGERGAVRFEPALTAKREAAMRLAMGNVVRVVLRFREPFWERLNLVAGGERADLSRLGFIHDPRARLPTWWTQSPLRAPLLVGWAGGSRADALPTGGADDLREQVLASLRAIFRVPQSLVEDSLAASFMHDWRVDPFARGAYSYVPVGGLEALERLAEPVEGTIFFAGEATNTEGHWGTVHGAISTGLRAAGEVVAAFKS
ncbi:MAG: FAD-dependent oxidoreductase [Acidobacteriota bacterium]|nr:FAD-dependent oxidoreductase [Acidobacteriota bacterium]